MSNKATSSEIELELTYLASRMPEEVLNVQPMPMVDIYIPEAGKDHPHLRLRQKGDKYEITKKEPIETGDASAQLETTIPLEKIEFDALSQASQAKVEKNRYYVVIEGSPAEVDVFEGKLKGLVLIDFEFDSEEDKSSFKPPITCLCDVTQEEFIAGGLLAGKSYADIRLDLERLNYKPIV
ncbi:MAG TPA: hypothetical protein PKC05_03950 [Candidatus Saccharibacteria bacterium]|nr:hypothetical protein [Candidatus Saccharibacteria bacterium]